jgi:ABC-type sugar transport system substrate-binding protein
VTSPGRRSVLLGLGALGLVVAAAGALAAPAFTASEKKIIARNPALRTLLRSDPGLVRRTLDEIAAAKASPGTGGRGMPSPDGERRDFLQRNPDLLPLESASPEAVNDLLKRVKAAGSGGGPRPSR